MGLLDTITDIASEAGTLIGGAIGGPGGAAIGGGIGRLIEGGGSNGSTRGQRRTRRGGRMRGGGSGMPSRTEAGASSPLQRGNGFDPSDLGIFGGPPNVPARFDPGGAIMNRLTGGDGGGDGQMQTTGGGAVTQSFQGALGQMMLKKSIRSKSGRAILEAMQSGALQRGLIQQTTTVQTPRGSENHSPPGFRTVYINDQPFAVFKPLARALRLLPKKTRSKITAADMKAIRKSDRLTKKIKKLAKKTGNLKVTNK